ncbi:MAG: hypothetical protein AAGH41_12100 [Pseudomonadota bacterium]
MTSKTLCSVAVVWGLLVCSPVSAATVDFSQTLSNPTPASEDNFGNDVAQNEDFYVVAALFDDQGAPDSGVVHIFSKETGDLVRTLTNPSPNGGDWFGNRIDVEGNTLAVSAYLDDTNGPDTGQVYLFNLQTGALEKTLSSPVPSASDRFGIDVSLSENHVIVGSDLADAGASNAGAAFVFDRSTGALVHTLNNPKPNANDQFGIATDIEGNFAVVGAQGNSDSGTNAGSIYVFDAGTGDLLYTIDNPAGQENGRFGRTLKIADGRVLVGGGAVAESRNPQTPDEPRAWLYDLHSGSLLHAFTDPFDGGADGFGNDVAINDRYAIITDVEDDNGLPDTGEVYIFDIESYELLARIASPDPASLDRFASVYVFENTLLAGAGGTTVEGVRAGSAYVFELTPIPVPGAFGLFVLGMSGAAWLRRVRIANRPAAA